MSRHFRRAYLLVCVAIATFLLNSVFETRFLCRGNEMQEYVRRISSLKSNKNELVTPRLEFTDQQHGIQSFSSARSGYFMERELNATKYSNLVIALRQCLSLSPDTCAGVTGVQEDNFEWSWAFGHGPVLEASHVMAVTFTRVSSTNLYFQNSMEPELSHLKRVQEVISRGKVWDGPIQDCFMENHPMGVSISFPTLQAAQEWCIRAAGCAGVTRVSVEGKLAQDSNSTAFVWEARKGPDLGISETGEVTYRWRLVDPCRVCAQHALGSLERLACNWDTGRGRLDIDVLNLSGCALSTFDGDGVSKIAVKVSAVCIISLPRRSDRWIRMWRVLQARGVPTELVRRFDGVDRRAFTSPDAMLQKLGYPAVNWSKFEEKYAELSQGTAGMERFKGKVGAWLAHLEVLRNLTADAALTDDPLGWAVLFEDDVVLLDGWETLLRKLAATIRASPGVDLVYLTRREQPFMWDGSRPGYVGVDAYAVRHSAIPGLLRYADLSGSQTRVLALDEHLSQLAGPRAGGGEGAMQVRKLWGGQSVANLFGKTVSDIEV